MNEATKTPSAKEELLRKGGQYLGAARSFLQTHCVRGSSVTWGSNEPLHDLTAEGLLDIATRAATAHEIQLKKIANEDFITISLQRRKNPEGKWFEATKTWFEETFSKPFPKGDKARECLKPPVTVAQVEDLAATAAAATL